MDFRGDRTVIIPTPGGQAPVSQPNPTITIQENSDWSGIFDDPEKFVSSGFNRLENAAFKLLSLIPAIKKSHTNPSAALLRQQMVEEVNRYETVARKSGVDSKTTLVGRYVLCTVLDEMVLNTPWGGQSDWRKHSLLSYFHQETWGGENFFVMLENLEKDPTTNIDLIELMYICLTLGFEGRYAVEPDRVGRLAEVRSRVYRVIRNQRGEPGRQLSPHWQGVAIANRKLRGFLPLWAYAAILLGIISLLYFFLSFNLNKLSEPPYQALAVLGRDAGTTFERPRVIDLSALEKLRIFLAPEIKEKLVSVEEREGFVRVIIQGDKLFDSGKVKLNDKYIPLMKRISSAFYEVEGKVLIEGHTDSQPINTLRFPSNWHLSLERAEEVKKILAETSGEYLRYEAEGRADTQPVADNATRQGRAKNRRVELVLLSNVIWRTEEGRL
ncbi:MAG: type VI secretion system protein TssL, long form [Chromatiales bacterium]|nr:type VI secretion system protein TssL, long form [Chromatiales bacterium]